MERDQPEKVYNRDRTHAYLVSSSVIKQISRDSNNFRGIVERIETVYTFTTYALHDNSDTSESRETRSGGGSEDQG